MPADDCTAVHIHVHVDDTVRGIDTCTLLFTWMLSDTVHWKAHEARKRVVYEPRALSSVQLLYMYTWVLRNHIIIPLRTPKQYRVPVTVHVRYHGITLCCLSRAL